jgi:hypothetical protein
MAQNFTPLLIDRALSLALVVINANDEALRTCFSGDSAPPNPVQGQLWYDTINNDLFQRRGGSWVKIATGDAQPLNANLSSLAGLTLAADKGLYATGVETLALYDLTNFGRTLGGSADAAAARGSLGIRSAILGTTGSTTDDSEFNTISEISVPVDAILAGQFMRVTVWGNAGNAADGEMRVAINGEKTGTFPGGSMVDVYKMNFEFRRTGTNEISFGVSIFNPGNSQFDFQQDILFYDDASLSALLEVEAIGSSVSADFSILEFII